MWPAAIFLFLLSHAYAKSVPNWKEHIEYVYKVQGRTLTSLQEISNQHSGILMRADLRIQPNSDGNLNAKILNQEYHQIHSELSDGWNTQIPDEDCNWMPLEMLSKSFQVELKYGTISGIIVSKQIPSWEANFIKSIMSQFQLKLDREGPNQKANEYTLQNFKVMEETITGTVETSYEVKQIPSKYVSTFQPWQLNIDTNEDVIEVLKHKNYNKNVDLPSYSFGFGGMEKIKPATNQMKEFFLRDSTSRAILSGNENNFTLRNSLTINKLFVNPTLSDKQKGLVVSMMNVTLEMVKPQEEIIEEVLDPLRLASLVYSYDSRHPEHSSLNGAPNSPLLPFTSGYKGRPVNVATDIKRNVQIIVRDIAKNMEHPTELLHQSTMSKFVTLTSLIRIMNKAEIERVGNELYSADEWDKTWIVFRDAVAEAGTGPSLLVIRNWILSSKITGYGASHILSTITKSVRKPSDDYMRLYFQLMKEDIVQEQWPLNDTAILSYSDLLREVYFHNTFYNAQYPIKSFPGMQIDDGVTFARGTVIPYLTEKLEEAIQQKQSHRVHVFIRALGNTGAPDIISIFEPYLEGRKQASRFQRLLMVVSLDKIVKTFSGLAFDACFRIYQNTGESEEIRTAAVYQLMRTKPTREILQLMASFTNIDTHEYVNAAVKSSIISAAKLEGHEFTQLRIAAKAAKPLLTNRKFGSKFGGNYLRTYFIEEQNLKYKETIQLLNSRDEFYPKGFKYALRSSPGGLRNQLVNVQALISSIDDLIHLGKGKQSNLQQLEGSLHFLDMGYPLKMISLDNGTLENIPKVIEMMEEVLENGFHINYTKFVNRRDLALSFPVEMGLPFLFTYDSPTLVQAEGVITAVSDPKISQGHRLLIPKKLSVSADAYVTITSKIQGRLTFTTPFDHQQYISGFDKHWQVHLPVRGGIKLDLDNFKIRTEVEPKEYHDKAHLIHYSTWPYTSRININDFQTVSSNPITHVIKPGHMHRIETTVGKEFLGLAARIQIDNWRIPETPFSFLTEQDTSFPLLDFWNDASMRYSQMNVSYIPEESPTKKLVFETDQLYKFKDGQQLGDLVRWYDLVQDGTRRALSLKKMLVTGSVEKLLVGPFSTFINLTRMVEAYLPVNNLEPYCIQTNDMTRLWKTQVPKGGCPDFRQMN